MDFHGFSMLRDSAKGINKFTQVNLAVYRQQPAQMGFSLSRVFSASLPAATAR